MRSLGLSVYLPSSLMAVAQMALLVVLPLYVLDLGQGLSAAALVFAMRGTGSVVVNVPASLVIERRGHKAGMLLGNGLMAASALVIAHAASALVLAPAMLAFGAGMGAWLLGRLACITERVPVAQRGKAMAGLAGLQRLGLLLGPLLGGVGVEQLGFRAVFLAVAGAAALTMAIVWKTAPPSRPERGLAGAAPAAGASLPAAAAAEMPAPGRAGAVPSAGEWPAQRMSEERGRGAAPPAGAPMRCSAAAGTAEERGRGAVPSAGASAASMRGGAVPAARAPMGASPAGKTPEPVRVDAIPSAGASAGASPAAKMPEERGRPGAVASTGRRAPAGLLLLAPRLLVRHRRLFLGAGVFAFCIQLVREQRRLLVVLWGARIGIDPETIGLIAAVAAAVDLAMAPLAGHVMDRWGRKAAGIGSIGILGAAMGLLPLTGSVAPYLCVAVLAGIGNGLGSGILLTLGADLAPAGERSRFLGVWRLVGDCGALSGPLLTAAAASLPAALALTSLIGVAGGAALWRRAPETLRRAPTH